MTMAIIPAQTGRISGIFWRRPALGLFLLLLGPLMWFGIVYLGSLLTLLWQSIYTFDDFTMSVTSDFTLANLRALFNPANYDIIVRTPVMALCVTLASALLALPMAPYMARYTSGKMKAFFISRSCYQCGPAISSKPMRGCCCWRKMAWRSGSSVILDWRGR